MALSPGPSDQWCHRWHQDQ